MNQTLVSIPAKNEFHLSSPICIIILFVRVLLVSEPQGIGRSGDNDGEAFLPGTRPSG